MEPNIAQNPTQLSQPVQQPIESNPLPVKKSLPKWPLLIVGIVLILIIGAGAYFIGQKSMTKTVEKPKAVVQKPTATPTPDPTANWKTYQGQYFSFKYPQDWSLDSSNKNSIKLTMVVNDKDSLGNPIKLQSNISVNFLSVPQNTTLNDWLKTRYFRNDQPLFNLALKSVKKTILSVSDALRIEMPGAAGYDDEGVVTIHNGYGLDISIIGDSLFGTNMKIFNQILSTFKFTDQTAQAQPTTLKIPEYGVQIALSDEIKDAYYINATADKGYVYLRVHSLDSELYCNDNSNLGVAALNKVGKDEIDQRTGGKFSDSGSGSVVGDYYYYIDLEQAVCSQTASNQTIETNARKAFGEASKTITAL
jgi:hypothetical protein